MAKKRIMFRAQGTSPLLMNAIPDDLLEKLAKGISTPKSKGVDVDLDEIAQKKIYLDDGGVIGIPMQNLLAGMKYAGRSVKIGKKNVSTADTTSLFSLCKLEGLFIQLDNGQPGTKPTWVRDMRRGVHRQGASRVMVALVRPRFDSWGFNASITYDDSVVDEKTLRQIVEIAGSKSGLCDFRPSCGGPFGCFAVTSWVIEKIEDRELAEATA